MPSSPIPVLTAEIPRIQEGLIDATNPSVIKSFQPNFSLLGGINLPKVIRCLSVDGTVYWQLVKGGNDDLKQDAVMQQVFRTMNAMLLKNEDSRQRKLEVRTYTVLPLSPSTGVMEFVNNTLVLGEWLIGTNGNGINAAHTLFRPEDWANLKCRKYLEQAPSTKKTTAFEEITSNFQPVLRHLFLNRYGASAQQWYQARTAYTRSVAVNSMVGYVLGIGDRHSMNILFDKQTAELIHIDFGIAFEQGLLLKTPEMVPFRLTRDIIDGMGFHGVSGPFTRVAELTLRILREDAAAILTILEVLLHDPLFKWSLTPALALLKQQDAADLTVDDPGEHMHHMGKPEAGRALFRVQQKLKGEHIAEDGVRLNVEAQVKILVHEAQDPQRLSGMFAGWAPWV